MRSFGQIVIYKTKKSHICYSCKLEIFPGEINIRSVGIRKNFRFANRYHQNCWLEIFSKGVEELLEIHRQIETGEATRKTPTKVLTEEQRKRRKVLQGYLANRDIPALLDAYNRHSTKRVLFVMNTIASRWEELHSMGVPFRMSLVREAKSRNKTEKALAESILEFDSDWLNHLYPPDAEYDQIMRALRRPDDQYLPRWPLDESVTMELTEVKDEPEAAQHYVDVPHVAGLDDL